MAISEKIELLGKDYYAAAGISIPKELTLSAIPTASELEFVTAENFDQTMIEKILPVAVEEKIDFNQLLEVDYNWLLRCLRILNYGPHYTTNVIYCKNCGRVVGEYTVDFRQIECKPLPENFKNKFVISRDEFLEYTGDIEFRSLTIKESLMAYGDTVFQRPNGMINRELARMCYMIRTMGNHTNLSPIEAKLEIEKNMTSADFIILKNKINELADFGLRAGGRCQCPKCHDNDATFIALIDDRFFRPTMGDLRAWKNDKCKRRNENTARSASKNV